MIKRCAVLVLCLGQAAPLAAQEASEAAGPWSGKVSLGYLATTGNTDTTSINSAFEVAYETGKWVHGLTGRGINASQSDETTAEAYELGWSSKYNLSETSYVFGRLDWRKDRFSGFEKQFSQTVGYGRRLIDTEAHTLNVELGVGAKQLDAADGASDDDFIVRGGLDYTWAFSETAEFTQDLVVESGSTNTFTESISAVRARLIGELALVASYTIRNNSDVPVGTDKTDTFSALSLEYAF